MWRRLVDACRRASDGAAVTATVTATRMQRRAVRTGVKVTTMAAVQATTASRRQQHTRHNAGSSSNKSNKSNSSSAASPSSPTGPRTRLPILQNVVRKALAMSPTTTGKEGESPYKMYPRPPHSAAATTSSAATANNHGNSSNSSSSSAVLYRDAQCVLVNDAYPKSTVHCLVLPLDLALVSLDSLTAQHVPLLRHCASVADGYVHFLKRSAPQLYARRRFITGFHALPSLPMLHMHLLTMDLDSPCLKTRRHYNSFATFFFLTSDKVIADLERHGAVTLHRNVATMRQLEEQDMQCLWCGAALANVPTMKAHIRTCSASKALE